MAWKEITDPDGKHLREIRQIQPKVEDCAVFVDHNNDYPRWWLTFIRTGTERFDIGFWFQETNRPVWASSLIPCEIIPRYIEMLQRAQEIVP